MSFKEIEVLSSIIIKEVDIESFKGEHVDLADLEVIEVSNYGEPLFYCLSPEMYRKFEEAFLE